jgi:hypothetical protein
MHNKEEALCFLMQSGACHVISFAYSACKGVMPAHFGCSECYFLFHVLSDHLDIAVLIRLDLYVPDFQRAEL